MKKILLPLVIIFLFSSCKQEGKYQETADDIPASSQSFNWLLGKWKRSNEEVGKETYEIWEKVGKNEYRGFGFTMENSDTIWQENIKLISRTSAWNFEVTGNGENHSTIFRLTKMGIHSFESENQENEFPKVISYNRVNSQLKAVISGGNTKIFFDFDPVTN